MVQETNTLRIRERGAKPRNLGPVAGEAGNTALRGAVAAATRARASAPPSQPRRPHAAASSAPAQTVTAVVVERDALVRAGVRTLLSSAPGMSVVAEAADFPAAAEQAKRLSPQVLVVGVPEEPRAALHFLAWSRDRLPASRVAALADGPVAEQLAFEILRTGVRALIDRSVGSEQLVHTVRQVAAGGAVLDPAVTRRLLERFVGVDVARAQRAATLISTLSDREREVLALVAQGAGNAGIARRLHLSEGAVKANISRLLIKIRCENRVQAACLAQAADLLRSRAA
jgi:DNA-binding NarL/FixJ family response regulator